MGKKVKKQVKSDEIEEIEAKIYEIKKGDTIFTVSWEDIAHSAETFVTDALKEIQTQAIEEKQPEPIKKKREPLEGVDYHRITGARCPKCKMDSAFVSNTLPWEDGIRIRYHDCRRSGCGARFKSIETL